VATLVAVAVPSKNNDIKQTSANIWLAQLAYRTLQSQSPLVATEAQSAATTTVEMQMT